MLVVTLQRFNVPTLPFLHPAVRVGPPLLCALTRSANLGLELLVQWLATSIYPTPPRGGQFLVSYGKRFTESCARSGHSLTTGDFHMRAA